MHFHGSTVISFADHHNITEFIVENSLYIHNKPSKQTFYSALISHRTRVRARRIKRRKRRKKRRRLRGQT